MWTSSPSRASSKVYYRSQPRASPDPCVPTAIPSNSLPKRQSGSRVRQQLQDIAHLLHVSQDRENEALRNLMSGLHDLAPEGDNSEAMRGSSVDSSTVSTLLAGRNEKASKQTGGGSPSSFGEGGVSESPFASRPQHSSSSSTSGSLMVRGQSGDRSVAVVENRSSVASKHTNHHEGAVVLDYHLLDALVAENDALRQDVAKYRGRSEEQQDHINRLLQCIGKYEATTVTPARPRASTRGGSHRGGAPQQHEASPRYATHTTSSLYRRAPHDSVRSGRSIDDSVEGPQLYAPHSTPHTPHPTLTPSPRHRHNPLLSESTMELLRMAERRVADGSSFLSP
jgi:hypothetical protein